MKRRVEAIAFTLTDAIGRQKNKGRPDAWVRQVRPVVSYWLKPTGASATNTRASHFSNTSE